MGERERTLIVSCFGKRLWFNTEVKFPPYGYCIRTRWWTAQWFEYSFIMGKYPNITEKCMDQRCVSLHEQTNKHNSGASIWLRTLLPLLEAIILLLYTLSMIFSVHLKYWCPVVRPMRLMKTFIVLMGVKIVFSYKIRHSKALMLNLKVQKCLFKNDC
jgi:hypothetical protein